MNTNDTVLFEARDGVACATLNRPQKFNCISAALIDGLDEAINQAESDARIRVLVLRANGKHFCTGADLQEVREHSVTQESLDAFIGRGHEVFQRLESSPIPVIAAINGYCLAGGLELAMCADVVFVAQDARLGCQHARYGLVPGWGGTQRLPRLVGLRRALDLMFSARWLDADEARSWGLVTEVTAPEALDAASLAYASELAGKNPEGLAAMKQLARSGAELPLTEALQLEQKIAVPALRSENVAEGLRAFRERREPRFR
ncbi:MAG: enoyl-CoA hydratase/isomerase family protein [Gammaproteobacteria bacterium]|nr:enoyl-CoA hydratase/isomerase family protein [Gammaproteobacteria bacterium]